MKLRVARKVLYRWGLCGPGMPPSDRRGTTHDAAVARWLRYFRNRPWRGCTLVTNSGRVRRC